MVHNARFEAQEGWVAVSPDGSVWCHRGRGNAGVLVFERDEGGHARYLATHQDCFSVDTSITTESLRRAVCFAVDGGAGAEAARGGAVEPPAAVEERGLAAAENDADCVGDREPEGAFDAAPPTLEAKADILAALPGLSPADRREVLDCLLALEAERARLGPPSP